MNGIFLQTAAAAVGTVAFSLLFSVPRAYYLFCGICGGAGWLVYALLALVTSEAVAVFFATVVVVLLSRSFAMFRKCPATIFLTTGIFPLVPGAGLYWTTYYTVTEQMFLASKSGTMALQAAVAIVLGIVVVFEIPQGVFHWTAQVLRYMEDTYMGGE